MKKSSRSNAKFFGSLALAFVMMFNCMSVVFATVPDAITPTATASPPVTQEATPPTQTPNDALPVPTETAPVETPAPTETAPVETPAPTETAPVETPVPTADVTQGNTADEQATIPFLMSLNIPNLQANTPAAINSEAFTVNFIGYGDTNSTISNTYYTDDTDISFPGNDLTVLNKAGYKFMGWAYDLNANPIQYVSLVSDLTSIVTSITPGATYDLFAHYVPLGDVVDYEIQYIYEDGTPTSYETTKLQVIEGTSTNVALPTFGSTIKGASCSVLTDLTLNGSNIEFTGVAKPADGSAVVITVELVKSEKTTIYNIMYEVEGTTSLIDPSRTITLPDNFSSDAAIMTALEDQLTAYATQDKAITTPTDEKVYAQIVRVSAYGSTLLAKFAKIEFTLNFIHGTPNTMHFNGNSYVGTNQYTITSKYGDPINWPYYYENSGDTTTNAGSASIVNTATNLNEWTTPITGGSITTSWFGIWHVPSHDDFIYYDWDTLSEELIPNDGKISQDVTLVPTKIKPIGEEVAYVETWLPAGTPGVITKTFFGLTSNYIEHTTTNFAGLYYVDSEVVGNDIHHYHNRYRLDYTFNANGGTFNTATTPATTQTISLMSGQPIDASLVPTASDLSNGTFEFEGWYDNASCAGEAVKFTNVPDLTQDGSLELFAKWSYDVTHKLVNIDASGNETPVLDNNGNPVEYIINNIYGTTSNVFTNNQLVTVAGWTPSANSYFEYVRTENLGTGHVTYIYQEVSAGNYPYILEFKELKITNGTLIETPFTALTNVSNLTNSSPNVVETVQQFITVNGKTYELVDSLGITAPTLKTVTLTTANALKLNTPYTHTFYYKEVTSTIDYSVKVYVNGLENTSIGLIPILDGSANRFTTINLVTADVLAKTDVITALNNAGYNLSNFTTSIDYTHTQFGQNTVINLRLVSIPAPTVPPTTPPATTPVPPVVVPPVVVPPVVVVPDPPVVVVPDPPVVEIPDPEPPLAETPEPEPTPTVEIEETETPLAQAPGWALLNLILAILTAVMSIILLVTYFTGLKDTDEYDEDATTTKRKGMFRIISVIVAIASVVLFLVTQDVRQPMIFVDNWTLVMAGLAALQTLVALLSRKKESDEQQMQGA